MQNNVHGKTTLEVNMSKNKNTEEVRCPYCGAKAFLTDSTLVYHTPKYGNMYVCSNFPKCDSYVGCHPNSTRPLGRLANRRLRNLRTSAHDHFDKLWKMKIVGNRRTAYKWLANKMNIDVSQCHIGMFNEEQCLEVIHICRNTYPHLYNNAPDVQLDKYQMFTRGYSRNKH